MEQATLGSLPSLSSRPRSSLETIHSTASCLQRHPCPASPSTGVSRSSMAAEGGVKIDVEAPAAAEVGGGEPVQLHVYDISQGLAKELSAAFLGTSIDGIWHTGVSAFGSEYFFGAGIQRSSSGSSPYGAPERVVNLGRTQVAKARLEAFLEGEEMSGRYMAASYDLLHHNCNHFSDEAAKFLGVAGVPEDILGLPRLVLDSPNRDLIMPLILYIESTLRNGGAPHIPLDMTSLLAGLPPAPEAPALLVEQPGTNGHLGLPKRRGLAS